MSHFRPYFNHGRIAQNLRDPPSGAAAPVNPHDWSYDAVLFTDPSESAQASPLIQTPSVGAGVGMGAGANERRRTLSLDGESLGPPTSQLVMHTELRRNGMHGIVAALAVFALSAGMATFFIVWLSVHQVRFRSVWGERAFMVDESGRKPRLTALTISALTSHLIFVTGPIFMTLIAFHVANLWLTEQSTKHERERVAPTALQYGLLMRVLGSLSILSMAQAVQYACRPSRTRFPSPRYYKEAISLAALIYVFMHGVGVADLWLHTMARPILVNSTMPAGTPLPNGVAFDDTFCPRGSLADNRIVCQVHPDSWGTQALRKTANLMAANVIVPNGLRVITLNESGDAAVLVPSSIEPAHSFRAPTFGVRASCQALDRRCDASAITQGKSTCAVAGIRAIPADDNIPFGQHPLSWVLGWADDHVLGRSSMEPGYALVGPNPAQIHLQLRWSDQVHMYTHQPNPALALSVYPVPELSIYAACELQVFNGTLEYIQGRYTLDEETPSTAEFASVIRSPLLLQLATPRLVINVQSSAMAASAVEEVNAILNQELARLTLASAGGLFKRAAADATLLQGTDLLTRYPLAPVIVFAAILYAYGAIALLVFLVSATEESPIVLVPTELSSTAELTSVSATELLQLRLTDPMTLVSAAYPSSVSITASSREGGSSPDSVVALSVREKAMDMFTEASMSSREGVYVGLGRSGRTGLPAFGVWRWGEMQYYTDWSNS